MLCYFSALKNDSRCGHFSVCLSVVNGNQEFIEIRSACQSSLEFVVLPGVSRLMAGESYCGTGIILQRVCQLNALSSFIKHTHSHPNRWRNTILPTSSTSMSHTPQINNY